MEPEITIVMPVRNEAASIEAALDAVLGQDLDVPFEVVAADGRSTDGTRALLERRAAADPRLRVVDNPDRLTPHALNRALAAARGRFLVRVDGHSLAPRDYVRRLVAHLRAGEAEGAGGRKRAVGTSRLGRAVAAAHGSRFGIGDSKYHYSAKVELVDHVPFGAYLTERARAIGGWDEELVRSQDVEFDHRYRLAGGRLLLDPSVVIDWKVRETLIGLARQYWGYGYWKVPLLGRDPSAMRMRWLVPPTLVLALVGGAAASVTAPGRLALAIVGAVYALFLLAGAASLAWVAGFRLLPHLVAALAVMHLSWGAGFVVSAARSALRLLGGRRRPRRTSGTSQRALP